MITSEITIVRYLECRILNNIRVEPDLASIFAIIRIALSHPVTGYLEHSGGSYDGVGVCPSMYGFPCYICLQFSDI